MTTPPSPVTVTMGDSTSNSPTTTPTTTMTTSNGSDGDASSTGSKARLLASEAGKKQAGRCDLILGPMFSGKSTEMLRRIRRYTIAQKNCLVIKYARDTRYSADKLATHDK
jgi:hypothetical protein